MSDRATSTVARATCVRGAVATSEERAASAVERVLSDDHLSAACSVAVDPLEIAARMETAGLSSQIVTDSFGYGNVFDLAQAVYDRVPFRAAQPAAPQRPLRGRLSDLLRGLLYAVPALLFSGTMTGLSIDVAWWALPVALVTGWGVAQATAALGWSLRGRGNTRSDAWLATLSLLLTSALSFGLALVALSTLGGAAANLLCAVGLAVYIAMSGILLLQGAERLLAACLLPGAVGTVLSHASGQLAIPPRTGSWSVVLSLVLVIVVAHRTALVDRWRRPILAWVDARRSFRYLLLGISCATITSAVIGFGAAAHATGDTLAIAVWPLLLTLGVMEWQLRTFRGRVSTALSAATTIRQFARASRRAFFASFGTYAGLLVTFSAVALAVGDARHATMLPLLLAAEGLLGMAFFLGLLVESSTRIDLTLIAWAISLTVLAGALVVVLALDGRVTPVVGLVVCLGATGVAVCTLAEFIRRVLASPLSN